MVNVFAALTNKATIMNYLHGNEACFDYKPNPYDFVIHADLKSECNIEGKDTSKKFFSLYLKVLQKIKTKQIRSKALLFRQIIRSNDFPL